MKLTIEQLSKLTKLSIPTLRVYVSRQKLGRKVGDKRVFSQSDVQKLLKSSKRPPAEKKIKPPHKKAEASKKTIQAVQKGSHVAKPNASISKAGELSTKSAKPSFWTRLFGGRKKKQKVNLLDVKTTK